MTKCPICGQEFEKKSNCQRFCSRKCQQKYARQKLKKAKTDARKCPVCGKGFFAYEESKQVCCSHDCYVIYHRNKVREHNKEIRKPKPLDTGCQLTDSCYYGLNGICRYILLTGKPRGCEIEKCEKYECSANKGQLPRMWYTT